MGNATGIRLNSRVYTMSVETSSSQMLFHHAQRYPAFFHGIRFFLQNLFRYDRSGRSSACKRPIKKKTRFLGMTLFTLRRLQKVK